jgi:hypothetical protein
MTGRKFSLRAIGQARSKGRRRGALAVTSERASTGVCLTMYPCIDSTTTQASFARAFDIPICSQCIVNDRRLRAVNPGMTSLRYAAR